jgi:hypothetical protein
LDEWLVQRGPGGGLTAFKRKYDLETRRAIVDLAVSTAPSGRP